MRNLLWMAKHNPQISVTYKKQKNSIPHLETQESTKIVKSVTVP